MTVIIIEVVRLARQTDETYYGKVSICYPHRSFIRLDDDPHVLSYHVYQFTSFITLSFTRIYFTVIDTRRRYKRHAIIISATSSSSSSTTVE